MIDEHDRETVGTLLRLLSEQRQWDRALPFARMVAFVDPHNAESHHLAAIVFLNKDEAVEALASADTALGRRTSAAGRDASDASEGVDSARPASCGPRSGRCGNRRRFDGG